MKSINLKTLSLLILFYLSLAPLFAGEIKYPVSEIPKQLLKDAKAVVRNEEINLEFKSSGKFVQKVTFAITILNKNGLSNSYFVHAYNNSIKVSNIKAQLYDQAGNAIKKKGGYDILDYAMISDGTMYADQRVKAINPEHLEYPYTVEYSYDVSFSDVLTYPSWQPIRDFNVAVEKSSYSLTVPKGVKCRYFEKNLTSKVLLKNTPEVDVYTWELVNQILFTKENFSPSLSDITPIVMVAPSDINIEGYEGNIESWQGLALWFNELNKGKNNLNSNSKAKIQKLVEGISDERTKVKKLYEYMQNRTRYVSVQVGIGGFQPFDAETVDRLAYGDCKALTNYMRSILEAAGISSKYTLVQAGSENPTIQEDFPSHQFNHAILCVPISNDTLWLECTSQNNPFNYLGTFTLNRKVLVIDSIGGTLVKIPLSKAESNLESRKVVFSMDQSGSGLANVTNIFHGATYDSYASILSSDQTDRKELVTRKIHISNFELNNFNIYEVKGEKPFVTEKLNLTVSNYSTRVGEKIILCLNMMNKLSESPFQSANRKNPVSIKWPVYEIDTIIYNLPQGYTLEKIPEKVKLQSDFGLYTTEVTKFGSSLQYIRRFHVFNARYPVERYEEIIAFFDKIVSADENKVMLTKTM